MIGDPIVGAEMTRRVQEMSDEGWYPFEEYIAVLRRLEDKLSTRGLAALAFNAVFTERETLLAHGFTAPEKLFAKYNENMSMYAKDMDPADQARTIVAEPGHAILEMPDRMPISLTEGYLRGFVAATGGLWSG